MRPEATIKELSNDNKISKGADDHYVEKKRMGN